VAVLVIHQLEPSVAVSVFTNTPPHRGLSAEEWQGHCERRGLVAFAAEDGDDLAGFAVAESHASAVQVLALEGGPEARTLLLDRLARLAGDRGIILAET
jgi:hypothetical protein